MHICFGRWPPTLPIPEWTDIREWGTDNVSDGDQNSGERTTRAQKYQLYWPTWLSHLCLLQTYVYASADLSYFSAFRLTQLWNVTNPPSPELLDRRHKRMMTAAQPFTLTIHFNPRAGSRQGSVPRLCKWKQLRRTSSRSCLQGCEWYCGSWDIGRSWHQWLWQLFLILQ